MFCKHVHTKSLQLSSLATAKDFFGSASIEQPPLSCCSTHSVMLCWPFFPNVSVVVVIASVILRGAAEGVCTGLLEYSSKCPLPTFTLK